jgi:hypothetical protein
MDETLSCVAVTLGYIVSKQRSQESSLFNASLAGNTSNKYALGKLRFDEEVPVRLSELTQGRATRELASQNSQRALTNSPLVCAFPLKGLNQERAPKDSCANCQMLLHLLDPSWSLGYLRGACYCTVQARTCQLSTVNP